MPVTGNKPDQETIYQREQYARKGLGRLYWDYRDRVALSLVRPADRVILDLGCGEGITLEKLARLFPDREVRGLDLLEENVRICRDHGLAAERGDVYGLALQDDSADFILFSEVIEHLERPWEAAAEIRRVLRPRGRLVVIFPNDAFFRLARLLCLRFREAAYDPGHLHRWKPREMERFLAGAGFEPVLAKNIPFLFWPVCLHAVVCAEKTR